MCVCDLLYGFQKLRFLGLNFFSFLYKETIFQTITESCISCCILIIPL